MMEPFKEGDSVLVIPGRARPKNRRPITATIVKAARVWLTIRSDDASSMAREWRMRRDTQNEGADSYYNDRFVTHEQYAAEQAQRDARVFLGEQGISIAYNSPWRNREVELAGLIRSAATAGVSTPEVDLSPVVPGITWLQSMTGGES